MYNRITHFLYGSSDKCFNVTRKRKETKFRRVKFIQIDYNHIIVLSMHHPKAKTWMFSANVSTQKNLKRKSSEGANALTFRLQNMSSLLGFGVCLYLIASLTPYVEEDIPSKRKSARCLRSRNGIGKFISQKIRILNTW